MEWINKYWQEILAVLGILFSGAGVTFFGWLFNKKRKEKMENKSKGKSMTAIEDVTAKGKVAIGDVEQTSQKEVEKMTGVKGVQAGDVEIKSVIQKNG